MQSILTLLFICVIQNFLHAQEGLSKEEIREDYSIVKDLLLQQHPALFDYCSEEEWNNRFEQFEKKEANQIHTSNQLFRSLCALTNPIGDGHFQVLHPTMDTIPLLFPVIVKILNQKIVTDTQEFGIPLGSEITSINGVQSTDLIQRMLKYAPSDGYNLTKKYRQIEAEFGLLHLYEFGQYPTYEVSFIRPDKSEQNVLLSPQKLNEIGKRIIERQSSSYKSSTKNKWPHLLYPKNPKTAVLIAPSFGLPPKEFKSKLLSLFDTIKKKKIKNLVVDVRNNIGGYRANAWILYSFLTNSTFKQRTSEEAISDTLFHHEHLVHNSSEYSSFFRLYFKSISKINEKWVLTKDHAAQELNPVKKPFKGNVVVLIGGNTFSAGSCFALCAKNDPNIVLIGEETGGGYYSHTGQFSTLYKLPHSKILIRMSLVKVNHFVADTTTSVGSGILPDIEITQTVKDLIKGYDTVLQSALLKFRSSN